MQNTTGRLRLWLCLWFSLAVTAPAFGQTVVNRPQSSFLAGQVSPLVAGRTDLAVTQSGCRTLRNMQVIDAGAVTRRPGSIYVATAPGAAYLYPWVYSEDDCYALEFSHRRLRFYRDTGLVLTGTTPYSVATPYRADDIDTLQFYQSSDVSYIVSTTGDYPVQKLVRAGHTSWTLTDCNTVFLNGPFMTANTTTTTVSADDVTGTVVLTASANVWDVNEHDGALWQLSHVMPTQHVWGTWASTSQSYTVVAGTSAPYTFEFTAVSFQGTVQLQVSYDQGSTWIAEYTATNATAAAMDVNDSDVSDFGHNVLLRVACTAYTAGSVDYDLAIDSYLHSGVVKLTTVASAQSATGTVVERLGQSDTATTRWAEGAWSDYRGYPTSITGHFGRVVYGRDLQIWFTAVEGLEDFANFFAADDEAFSWRASQSQQNPIRWMIGDRTQNMVVGTLNKVMELRSLDELLGFTPLNPPKISSASAIACSTVLPAVVETAVIFADRTNRHLHELIYESGAQTVTGPDLTQIAGPILGTTGVRQIAVQQTPWPTIWCVRDDGEMASCYYSRSYQHAAWSEHDTTDGLYRSVAVVPTAGGLDRVWTSVQRIVNGNTVHYVEYLPDLDVDAGSLFVDSSLTFDGGAAVEIVSITRANPGTVTLASWPTGLADGYNIRITGAVGMTEVNDEVFTADDCNAGLMTLTLDNAAGTANWNTSSHGNYMGSGTLSIVDNRLGGLSHVEGEDVAVWADGEYRGDYTVGSGAIALDDYYNEVYAGLNYWSVVTPLEVDLLGQFGSTQPSFKRITHVLLNVYETAGPKCGITSTSARRIPWPALNAGDVESPGALHTGSNVFRLDSGPRQEASYTVFQNEPYPMTLRGLVPIFELGN